MLLELLVQLNIDVGGGLGHEESCSGVAKVELWLDGEESLLLPDAVLLGHPPVVPEPERHTEAEPVEPGQGGDQGPEQPHFFCPI